MKSEKVRKEILVVNEVDNRQISCHVEVLQFLENVPLYVLYKAAIRVGRRTSLYQMYVA